MINYIEIDEIKTNLKHNKLLMKKYSEYKSRAKSHKINFELELFDFYLLVTNSCYSCGRKDEDLLGVDRVNNNYGYTVKNSRTCCWDCNRLKSDKTLKQHSIFIKRLNNDKGEQLEKFNKKHEELLLSPLQTFPEMENNKKNTDLIQFLGVFNYKPQILSIIEFETDLGKVYQKTFYIYNVQFNYMDTVEFSTSFPTQMITKIVSLYAQYINGEDLSKIKIPFYYKQDYMLMCGRY